MKTIIKLVLLVAIFLLLAGTYFSFYIKSGEPAALCLLVSVLFGAFLLLGCLAVVNLVLELRDERMIEAATRGVRPTDGKRCAVLGPVSPVGEPLRAPFGGEPCIAYEYRIFHMKSGRERPFTVFDFEGWASVPSEVTTDFGKVRLLGLPYLGNFGWHKRLDYGRANSYVRETYFQQSSLKNVFKLKEYLDAYEQQDKAACVREDIRHSDATEASGLTLEERLIPVGERIFAVGKFSRRREGLVQDSGLGLRLHPSSAGTAKKGMTTGFQVFLACTLIGFAVMILFLNPATRDMPKVLLDRAVHFVSR